MLPNWPVFNVADMCINVAAGLIMVQAFRGDPASTAARDVRAQPGREAGVTRRTPTSARSCGARGPGRRARRRRDGADVRPLPHPGRRPDRRRATSTSTAPPSARATGCYAGLDARRARSRPTTRPARGGARDRRGHQDHPRRRRHRGDRQAGRRRRAPVARAGPGPPSSATSPAPASASPPAAPPSGRASCSASTSAPPA